MSSGGRKPILATRRLRDWILPSAIAVSMAAFFWFGLIYPLGTSMTDAVRLPARTALLGKGESLAAFAARQSVPEAKVRALNDLAEGTEPKAGAKLIVEGPRWTTAHVTGLFDPDAPQWRWIINSQK